MIELTEFHSPACILSFLLTALARGELNSAWAWSDEPEERAPEIEEKTEAQPLPPQINVTPASPVDLPTQDTVTAAPTLPPAVAEKVDTEPEISETEGKPKAKKNKKKGKN